MNDARTPAHQRDFKGVFIPKDIWCNPGLTGDEKMMWGEIYALDNEFGCIADNVHFMEMFGWNNERKPQRIIKALKEKELITVTIDKKSDDRVIRVTGKYRHLDRNHMTDLEAMRAELAGKMNMRRER